MLIIQYINSAWIFHREEINTLEDGNCNVYLLLDAFSRFVFGHVISINDPKKSDVISLLEKAHDQSTQWPTQILISKNDPYIELLTNFLHDLNLELIPVLQKDLNYYLTEIKELFYPSKKEKKNHLSDVEEAELKAFIPETYAPCHCGSGKKFKFCCQKIFEDITYAMCAAEEGRLDEALKFMNIAQAKVGKTPEVLCRLSICWSFYDEGKAKDYLDEALKLNKNHPRSNYLLGIYAMAHENYINAILYYQNAIDHYPKSDKFHLNEAYNNLGTAYFRSGKFQLAKEAWEQGLVLLPTDKMTKRNLFECIYENKVIPIELREISPYIKKYLDKY